MRRLALPLALMVVMLASGAASAASTTAFTGEWIGNDPVNPGDGSVVHLYVTGGTHAKITFTDEFGSVCVNVGSPVTFFTSTITGTVYGDLLLAGTFRSAHCGPVPVQFLNGENVIYFLDDQGNDDPADDTLWDGSVTWSRFP